MFFFFDEQDPNVSGMAFESYVINVLRDYLKAQEKTIFVDNGPDLFDATLPEGIDDMKGPIHLEIKLVPTNKSGYFRSVERFARQASEAEAGAILLILGTEFTDDAKLSMTRMVESRAKRKAYVWDIADFNRITDDFSHQYRELIESPAKAMVEDAINNPPSEKETTDTKAALIETLKREYQKEDIALFLGAGISKDAGIPQWNELVNALLSKMILSRLKGKDSAGLAENLDAIIDLAHQNQENSPITQMRYIKGAFNSTEYNKLVHDVLYSKEPKIDTELLNALAALCTPRRNHIGVQGVITYNFDDLLERCLAQSNVMTNIVASEDDITSPDKLSIFHVHGYMPQNIDDNHSDTELIFSEEDYHKVYRDAYCWSNLTQLNYLREHTCLFVGCSLTDPNLRRLLDVAKRTEEKPRHFAFLRRNKIKNKKKIDKEALKVYEDIDLSIREKYYTAIGINVIWVDSFKEIPQILKSLLE